MSFSVTINEAPNNAWIVGVHGMSQDHRYFSKQADLLRTRFNLLLIDLPGHGLASDVEGPFGHVEMAKHIALEVRDSGISNACYWGTHTGATLAPLILGHCPGAITALVLEGPGIAGQNPPVVVDSIERATEIARDQGITAALDFWWKSTPWFDAMRQNPEDFRAAEHLAMVNGFSGRPWLDRKPAATVEDTLDLLKTISIPTLVYTGELDHPDFQHSADRVSALINRAQRHQIAGTGGFPAWETPEPVTRVVVDFLHSTHKER